MGERPRRWMLPFRFPAIDRRIRTHPPTTRRRVARGVRGGAEMIFLRDLRVRPVLLSVAGRYSPVAGYRSLPRRSSRWNRIHPALDFSSYGADNREGRRVD